MTVSIPDQAARRVSERENLLGALSLFVLIDLLLFLPAFLAGSDRGLGWECQDSLLQNYYWRTYATRRLLQGELPLWNPHVFAGTPFLAGLQAGTYYFPNLLYLLLPTGGAMLWTRVAHFLWTQVGTRLLALEAGASHRGAVLAAVVFSLSTQFTYRVYSGHFALLDAAAWMPWIFLAAIQVRDSPGVRTVIRAAAAAAMQLLTGHAQVVYLTWLPLFVVLSGAALSDWLAAGARRVLRDLGLLALVVVIASLLAAAALAPTLELVWASNRTAFSQSWVTQLSLPPYEILTLAMPWFFGGGHQQPLYWGKSFIWETSLYVGLLPLLLLGRTFHPEKIRAAAPWAAMAGVSALLSFGGYSPVFVPLARAVPGMGLFRAPCKFLIPMALALAVLTAIAADGPSKNHRHPSRGKMAPVPTVVAVLMLLASALLWVCPAPSELTSFCRRIYSPRRLEKPPRVTEELVRATTRQSSAAVAYLVVAVGLGRWLLHAERERRISRRIAGRAMVAFAVTDLLLTAWPYMTTYPLSLGKVPSALEDWLAGQSVPQTAHGPSGGPWRVSLRRVAGPNHVTGSRLETADGYEGILPQTTCEFYNAMEATAGSLSMYRTPRPGSGTRLLAQRYYVFEEGERPVAPELQSCGMVGSVPVWFDPEAVPRVRLTRAYQVFRDRSSILQAMTAPGFRPDGAVLLEEEPGLLASPEPVAGSLSIEQMAPEYTAIAVVAPASCLLVLADGWYPAWKVRVDGTAAPLLRAYGFLRAVSLPSGRHRVEFHFDSSVALAGLAVSTLAWLLALVAAVRCRGPSVAALAGRGPFDALVGEK
ncbi:MAG: hypothetical protein HY303_13655 [Candidatus Wallbacteria bacterium]|nr:hypothetical protein [Candidatus Wallbacteria bacterium]